MWNESRLKPYEPVAPPGEVGLYSGARPVPPGTIARGQLASFDPRNTGRGSDGQLLTTVPYPVTKAVLQRGQERYQIYCTPCHGRLGDGRGMVVERGFPHPPDYALPRIREAPVGHFYDVMTNGYGVMYSYANRIAVRDRWAIAAYIRVLQNVRPVVNVDLYEEERERARRTGVIDPNRGMRLHRPGAAPGHGAEPAPGGAHGTPAPGAHGAPPNTGPGSAPGPAPAGH